MKRFIITIVTAFALLGILASTMSGTTRASIGLIGSNQHGIQVDVWTDRQQDAVYAPGDPITVYFRATNDCFLSMYSIGTDGDVALIFPEYPDDGFIYGGITYRLPDYYSGMRLRISGQRGIEYLHAVATRDPGAFLYETRRGRYELGIAPISGDPFLAINAINGRIIRARHIAATATVSYFVGGRVWYPRYACYDCHGRSVRFDPYELSCSRYAVTISGNYDYWWGYDYHPVRSRYVFTSPFWSFSVRKYPLPRRSYVDCAFGYRNYYPLRPILRPPTVVVYRPVRVATYASWVHSYSPVRYVDTREKRSRDSRTPYRIQDSKLSSSSRSRNETQILDASRDGRTEITRQRDTGGAVRTRSETNPADGVSTRSRSETTPADGVSTRSRSETTPTVPVNIQSRGSDGTSSRTRQQSATSTNTGSSVRDVNAGSTRTRIESTSVDANTNRGNNDANNSRTAAPSISSPSVSRGNASSTTRSRTETPPAMTPRSDTRNTSPASVTGNTPDRMRIGRSNTATSSTQSTRSSAGTGRGSSASRDVPGNSRAMQGGERGGSPPRPDGGSSRSR